MILAIVDFTVSAADQVRALSFLATTGPAARAEPGNLGFRAFANTGDPTHVAVLHEWDSPQSFEAWLDSDTFAAVSATLRPMMTTPPVSRRFETRLYAPEK